MYYTKHLQKYFCAIQNDNIAQFTMLFVKYYQYIFSIRDPVHIILENNKDLHLTSCSICSQSAISFLPLQADDADTTKSYNFVLANVQGRTDATAFTLTGVGNEARITAAGGLNYESGQTSYQFLVTTQDAQNQPGNVLFSTATVTVIVTVSCLYLS